MVVNRCSTLPPLFTVPSNECGDQLLHALCLLQLRANDRYHQQQRQADRLRYGRNERRGGRREEAEKGVLEEEKGARTAEPPLTCR